MRNNGPYFYLSLNKWAEKFVQGELIECVETVRREYADGSAEIVSQKQKRVSTVHMDEDWHGEFRTKNHGVGWLRRYIFHDGRVFTEGVEKQVQTNGGLLVYLILKDSADKPVTESRWTKEEKDGFWREVEDNDDDDY